MKPELAWRLMALEQAALKFADVPGMFRLRFCQLARDAHSDSLFRAQPPSRDRCFLIVSPPFNTQTKRETCHSRNSFLFDFGWEGLRTPFDPRAEQDVDTDMRTRCTTAGVPPFSGA